MSRRELVVAGAALALALPAGANSQGSGLPPGFEMMVGDPKTVSTAIIEGEPTITVRSQRSGGIARIPVDVSIEDGFRLAWDWKVNALPSDVAETSASTHDYTSVAIEFDDGRDLSWYWSAAVPAGQHFPCPLPGWPHETHYVLRTGAAGLGTWASENRDIKSDVVETYAAKAPKRVVAVWIINYTVPQKKLASTDIRRIRFIRPDGAEQAIFPK